MVAILNPVAIFNTTVIHSGILTLENVGTAVNYNCIFITLGPEYMTPEYMTNLIRPSFSYVQRSL
jgi:hypothetical protein